MVMTISEKKGSVKLEVWKGLEGKNGKEILYNLKSNWKEKRTPILMGGVLQWNACDQVIVVGRVAKMAIYNPTKSSGNIHKMGAERM